MLARLSGVFESHRRFAADASHELRTPLAGMRAQADVVIADSDASSDAVALAEQVVAGSIRSERMIDGLLTLARSGTELHDSASIDLAELVGDVIDARLEQAAAAGLRITLELHDAVIEGDPVLIERMIDNLIANAIDHNREGGEIDVSVTTGPTPTVTVANTGRVLTQGELTDIRRPFRRGRTRNGTGHGLGLTIVGAVAEAHGASLAIEPRSAGGLVATIRFLR
jgi:signal transduction histidine kinase